MQGRRTGSAGVRFKLKHGSQGGLPAEVTTEQNPGKVRRQPSRNWRGLLRTEAPAWACGPGHSLRHALSKRLGFQGLKNIWICSEDDCFPLSPVSLPQNTFSCHLRCCSSHLITDLKHDVN